ncbi:MAG: PaaI family thioesterase [bacterium]
MTRDSTPAGVTEIRHPAHRNCVVCGPSNSRGLALQFTLSPDGGVRAVFTCGDAYEGYAGLVHGGVISSVLDGAMTHCVFARGCTALTAELNVRFRQPVVVGAPITVRAWIDRSRGPLHLTRAELTQNHEVKATAEGKFIEDPLLIERMRESAGRCP